MSRRACLALLLVLCHGVAAPAQSTLDHIPPDAVGAFVIRNLNELKTKGDKLIDDAKLDIPLRLSNIVPLVYMALGLPGGEIDETGSVALLVANPKLIDPKAKAPDSLDKCLVLALPFKKLDDFEKAMGLEAGILKGGQAVKIPKQMGALAAQLTVIAMRGKHVYLGSEEKVVAAVSKSKGLSGDLTATQQKQYGQADVLLHLGTEAWGDLWKGMLDNIGKKLEGDGNDAEKKTASEFVDALRQVKFGIAGLRVDGGIGLNVLSVFPKDGNEAAKKFLTAFRAGEGAASLRGLPEGNVVAATAARGDGTQNGAIARVLLRVLVEDFLVPNRFLGAADRPALLGIFSEVWQRLRGSRLALYRTADASELGLFSLVGIMDTEDPKQFLEELACLAKLGSADGLDFKTEEGKKATEAEIDRLIKDLGHRRYQVREAAAVKLALAGEPVLPYLEKATRSNDLETRRRAEAIKREIIQGAEDRRKELLSGDLARSIKPSFAFLDRKEKVEGVEVQLIGVKLTKKDAASVPQLKALLGPDWNRVRMAVHGNQVVALIGSDLGLFQKTIRNLKEDRAGLAAVKLFEGQRKQTDPKRKLELHGSAQIIYTLASAQDLQKPAKVPAATSLTSLTLSVEADRFQVDFWLPAAEMRAINEAGKQ